jgi:L-lactate dehydrogenase complex protein LldG
MSVADARQEILNRVSRALVDIPADEQPADVPVERAYRTTDPDPDSRIDLFVERVTEYRAKVHRIGVEVLASKIADLCAERGIRRLVVPADIPEAWVPAGSTTLRDTRPLTDTELNESDGVLDRGERQGRRVLTLLPDYHLCVVFEDQIVGIVPEAIAALSDSARSLNRPMTWISGPSATSDIELNRVEGVHGPRTLEVLVVAGRESEE